jgi:hypothetical protein
MEKYYSDDKFRKIYSRLVKVIKTIHNDFILYHHTDSTITFKKYMKEFTSEYKNDLYLDDFLTAICKPLENCGYPNSINFLIWIAREGNIENDQKIKIFKYIYETYPDQIIENQNEIINGICNVYGIGNKLECIALFCDDKYNWLHNLFSKKGYDGEVLYNKFIDKCRRLKLVEKENEVMKNENMDLRKKIEDLELQIRYMPYGVGYLEAKEHFESLKN